MLLRIAITSLCLTAAAPAQVVATSPAGMLNVPGDTFAILGPIGPFVPDVYHKLTQIDGSQPPGARVISALSFRRPSSGISVVGGTAMVAVRMAHADYSRVVGSTGQSVDTLRTGAWVDVFTLKQVTLPSWSPVPQPPAPFDLRLPLDVPFSFDGQQALLFQVLVVDPNNSTAVDASNRSSVSAATQVYGQGSGCMIGTREMTVTASWSVPTGAAQGPTFFAGANPGPGLLPGLSIVHIGASAANQAIPGICAPLLTSADTYMTLNQGLFGTFRSGSVTLPSNAPFVGQTFHIQAWAQLSGQPQPFVGSSAVRLGPIPAARTDGFRAALYNDPENGATFSSTVWLAENRAVIIGIE
ncbi:MAG: hypothetical protein HZB39_07610 [Planctomycetes bacterium]|nr:hypothetical protein [Planctomycetota bacterium]